LAEPTFLIVKPGLIFACDRNVDAQNKAAMTTMKLRDIRTET
jgi:hypothetical protein